MDRELRRNLGKGSVLEIKDIVFVWMISIIRCWRKVE